MMKRLFLAFTVIIALFFACCRLICEAALTREEEQTIDIFERVSPSVVFIKNAALQWDWFSTNVYEIPRGAGAHQAGLLPTRRDNLGRIIHGDVITEIDGKKIENNDDMIEYIEKENKRAGDKIDLRFIRENKEYGTTAVLREI